MSLLQDADFTIEVLDLFIFLLECGVKVGFVDVDDFDCDDLTCGSLTAFIDPALRTFANQLIERVGGHLLIASLALLGDSRLLGLG